MPAKQLKLGAFFNTTGHHVASWRHPGAQADAGVNFAHWVEISRTAERGKFDFVFLADTPSVREGPPQVMSRRAQYVASFEPLTLIAALSALTERIGFVSTASTSWSEPYNLARQFASIDHISGGRAGWNIVTSSRDASARNFGHEEVDEHGARYARAREFTEVVRGLWDSWADDAFLRDKASGIFFDPAKVRPLNHRGAHFSVAGPLNVARPPQGRPVLVQAGASDDGRDFAAEYADAIFTNHLTLESAQRYYADVKARAQRFGRDPQSIVVMPGLAATVGSTREEALERHEYLQSLVDPVVGLELLTHLLGTDLSAYPLDGPLPDLKPARTGSQATFENWTTLARRDNLTIRQLVALAIGANGKSVVAGTPSQIADHMQHWFENGAADGFNIHPAYLPGAHDEFVDRVIPELQARGLFRSDYEGTTLREHLGLPRPERVPDRVEEPVASAR
jgi:FMN-dependent oxidoreductase (nitrilotriacetate monooxygenase family)